MFGIRRREFITLLGGAAAAWPLAARAQQPAMPVIGFRQRRDRRQRISAMGRIPQGPEETGYVEGRNVSVEYHWMAGQYDRLPALIADLVRRQVAVIATPGFTDGAIAAKAATTTIPIVFGVPEDPVKLGLVASLARPGGNATGINFFAQEVTAKRLGLLHELVPKAARIAVLVNPASPSTAEPTLKEVQEAARTLGLQILFSTPAPSARSMRPLPHLRANEPTPSLSPAMDSSTAVACNLPRSRRAIACPRLFRRANTSKPAG